MPIIVPIGTGLVAGTGIVTYSGLVSTLGDWLNRGDTDYTTQIPTFVALLEAKLNRTLRVIDMEETVALVADPAADLPTDFLAVRSLRITDGGELEGTSLRALHEAYEDVTGTPAMFAIADGEIHLGPAPADEEDLTLVYFQAIPALSADNETNWLITNHPDIYLFGSLTMAEAFLWNDERIPLWKSALEEALDELRKHGIKKAHGGSLVPRARNVA